MSETEAKPISAAPAEAEKPQTKGKAYKGTPEEERVKQLLKERNAARLEASELQQQVDELHEQLGLQQPSEQQIEAVWADGRAKFFDFERTVNELRLAPRVMAFLISQPDGARLLYALAVGSRYTRQRDEHFSGTGKVKHA